jgi:hypothetical protein
LAIFANLLSRISGDAFASPASFETAGTFVPPNRWRSTLRDSDFFFLSLNASAARASCSLMVRHPLDSL